MVFSSLFFLFTFLPVVLAVYYLSPGAVKNFVLFLASLIFYAWGEPVYVLLMVFSTAADYLFGRGVAHFRKTNQMASSRLILFGCLISNVLILGFFKYADFLVGTINALLHTTIPMLHLPLPIGISFYTFQSMSYVIDVYRGQVKVQKNLLAFGTYISLFPQLIAGPIVRYQTVEQQMQGRIHCADLFAEGVRRFILGLGKKVLLANNIGMLWDTISAQDVSSMPVLTAWLGILAFTFQIYFDFSGYSDMAIGLGKMFGFHFLENFNYPYTSKSITEFWRRWHISLGSWFREYVYIPLGGNKKGLAVQLRNIAAVWLLTGVWHGASWNFVLWGAYFGFLLVCEKIFLLRWLDRLPAPLRHVYTMFFVILSWVIFSFDSASAGLAYLSAMLGMRQAGFVSPETVYYLYTNAILFAILILGSTPVPKRIAKAIALSAEAKPIAPAAVETIGLMLILILSIAYLVNSSYNPFLYFRF